MKTNYWQKFEELHYYHIYNRSISGTNLFSTDTNYYFFLKKWKKLIYPYFDTAAYCLLPDHFHFLVRVKYRDELIEKSISQEGTVRAVKVLERKIVYNDFLEDQFKRLFSAYTLALNKQRSRRGSLFQKRFKRIRITDEDKLRYLVAYIHHNPIHHKYCESYDGWLFSSYRAIFSEQPTSIIREEIKKWFVDSMLVEGTPEERIQLFHDTFRMEKYREQF